MPSQPIKSSRGDQDGLSQTRRTNPFSNKGLSEHGRQHSQKIMTTRQEADQREDLFAQAELIKVVFESLK